MKKLKFAALAAACVMGFAAPAFADAMAAFYGNTAEVKQADGATVKYQFAQGGAFTLIAPDGAKVTGTWVVEGAKLCLTPAGGQKACTATVEGKKVGDTWDGVNDQGQKFTVTLKAGQ